MWENGRVDRLSARGNSTAGDEILLCCCSSFIPTAECSFNHKHNSLTLVLMQGGSVCVAVLCVCVCVRASACVCINWCPFARVVVGECQRPMGSSQRAGAARATAATQAASLLTRRSGSERAPGGGRPRLHSFKQQALRWNIDVTASHTVLPVSHMYRTCVTHTVDLFSQPCCWYRGAADLWIL